jgi:hypothetical protein
MENYSSETTRNHAQIEFLDLLKRGDDFFQVELLRPAKSYYEKAMKLNLETDKVKEKIAECDRLLAFEMKVIRILVAIAIAVTLISYMLIK